MCTCVWACAHVDVCTHAAVGVCACVWTRECIWTCVWACGHVDVYMRTCAQGDIYIHVHVDMRAGVCMYAHVGGCGHVCVLCTCEHVCIYLDICACMWTCIWIVCVCVLMWTCARVCGHVGMCVHVGMCGHMCTCGHTCVCVCAHKRCFSWPRVPFLPIPLCSLLDPAAIIPLPHTTSLASTSPDGYKLGKTNFNLFLYLSDFKRILRSLMWFLPAAPGALRRLGPSSTLLRPHREDHIFECA